MGSPISDSRLPVRIRPIGNVLVGCPAVNSDITRYAS
jgi:hypothetical protein